jgi:hypothetical protein
MASWLRTKLGLAGHQAAPSLEAIGHYMVLPVQLGSANVNLQLHEFVAMRDVAPTGSPTILVLFRRFG